MRLQHLRPVRRLAIVALALLLAACATPTPRSPMPEPVAVAPPTAEILRPAMPPPAAKIQVLEDVPVADLWQRYREQRYWKSCELTPAVQRWTALYAGRPERFAQTLQPILPLMEYVLEEALALGLPSEVILIPIVESHYRSDARGPGGALGMWQLMPDTGRRFGLGRSGGLDERTDVQLATHAALRLLAIDSEAFDANAKLVFAAYNAGGYRMRKALHGREMNGVRSLAGLGLTRTTENYIDKIKALNCLFSEPERFNLALPTLDPEQRLRPFVPERSIDPAAAAKLLGLDEAQLRNWNRAAFARAASDSTRPLLLPVGALAPLQEAVSADRLASVSPRTPAATEFVVVGKRSHRVVAGDSLWAIATRYRVRLADLMRWNGLNGRSVLRLGQVLTLEATP